MQRKYHSNRALALASKAEQIGPNSAGVLDTLGWVQYRRGVYADAEKSLPRAPERAIPAGRPTRSQRIANLIEQLGD